MHTALLYIAKKQLNMEERAGEVVPSPGVCAFVGGKRVRYLGGVTSDQLDLSSLAKALNREFCFGRKKKKTWNHTLGSYYAYEAPLFNAKNHKFLFHHAQFFL